MSDKKEPKQKEQTAPDASNETPTEQQSQSTQEEQAVESQNEKILAELTEQTEKYLRLCAEYDNYRKRSQKERESIYPEATASAIAPLLPVADSFERAINAPCSDENYKKGTEMTYKLLLDAFEKIGVVGYAAPGDTFDPTLHNAVMTENSEEYETNTIIEVFQKGYRIGERVIRFAMVKVAN